MIGSDANQNTPPSYQNSQGPHDQMFASQDSEPALQKRKLKSSPILQFLILLKAQLISHVWHNCVISFFHVVIAFIFLTFLVIFRYLLVRDTEVNRITMKIPHGTENDFPSQSESFWTRFSGFGASESAALLYNNGSSILNAGTYDLPFIFQAGEKTNFKFVYSHGNCSLPVCTSGTLRNHIRRKLNLEERHMLDVTSYELLSSHPDISKLLRNESYNFMGGAMFMFSVDWTEDKDVYTPYYNVDYILVSNASKLNKNVFLSDGSVSMVADLSQQVIHKAILDTLSELQMADTLRLRKITNGNEEKDARTILHLHPFPNVLEVTTTSTDTLYHNLLPLLIAIALFIVTIQAHYTLNNERTSQRRLMLQLMGMKKLPYFLSFYCIYAVFLLLGIIIFIAAGYVYQINYISLTNPVVMFIIVLLLALNLLTTFFCCSTCFCIRTNRAISVHGFIFLFASLGVFFFFAPILGVSKDSDTQAIVTVGTYIFDRDPSLNFWLHLIPMMNFFKLSLDISGQTMDRFHMDTQQYVSGPGYGFKSLFTDLYPNLNDNMQMLPLIPNWGIFNLLFMVATIIINSLLTLYFDSIFAQVPGGRKEPFYYPLLPSFWTSLILGKSGKKNQLAIDVAKHDTNKFSSVLVDTDEDIYQEYQNVVSSIQSGDSSTDKPLKIVKLSKTYMSFMGLYNGGNKTALDSLTFSCDTDQITVLLGHNGSGKSTCLNILTGVVSPSSGDALYDGESMIYQMEKIRSDLGVCLQHDVIFDAMSAYQTMQLFAVIRGIPLKKVKGEIKEKLEMVKLWKYRNQTASTYSGGMKRRLSLAIACLGDPSYLILDEICSGVDPAARQLIWDVLGKLKKDRSVLLSTHDLHEAEIVADKVVILALGRCRGLGTTQHLKNRYGGGFSVQVVSNRADDLKQRITEIAPEVEVESESHGNIYFDVPPIASPTIIKFFKFLEQQAKDAKESHGDLSNILVKDFDLSQTSLEQIFLQLTHGGKRTFSRRNNQNSEDGQKQLNIAIEGQDDCIGFVDINPSMTIETLRRHIVAQISNAPKSFVFLSNGIPLGSSQEATKYANQFLPLLVIRPLDRTQDASQSSGASQDSSLVDSLQKENQQLRFTISNMEKRLQEMEAAMKKQQNEGEE